MIIRAEQMQTFEAAGQAGFEAEVVEHVKQTFPHSVAGVEDAGIRKLVSKACADARGYGFRASGPVRMFVDFAVLLGHEFPNDPLLYWVRDILRDKEGLDEMTQAARLHRHVSTYLELVYGSGGEHLTEGLRYIAKAEPRELETVGRSLEYAALTWLQSLHYRKCAYVGDAAIQNLTAEARPAAERFALPEPEGPALLLGLMFAFGSGVMSDPLYPWAAESVAAGGEPKTRLDRLCTRSQAYLRQALANRKSG
jgi:hypothetical protein